MSNKLLPKLGGSLEMVHRSLPRDTTLGDLSISGRTDGKVDVRDVWAERTGVPLDQQPPALREAIIRVGQLARALGIPPEALEKRHDEWVSLTRQSVRSGWPGSATVGVVDTSAFFLPEKQPPISLAREAAVSPASDKWNHDVKDQALCDKCLAITEQFGTYIPHEYGEKRVFMANFHDGAVTLRIDTDTWVGRNPPNCSIELSLNGNVVAYRMPGYQLAHERRPDVAMAYLDSLRFPFAPKT